MEDKTSNETVYTCPNCGNEVSIDDDHCSKCGVELTFENDYDDETTIVIKTYSNEFEAQVAKGILDEEGIESFVSKDDEGSMGPYLQSSNGVDLHIFKKDKDKAEEILNAFKA